MKLLQINLLGRFGNQMFGYAYGRAYSEANGYTICNTKWVGDLLFDIESSVNGSPDVVLPQDYRQNQVSMIYTNSQIRRWFKIKQWILDLVPQYKEQIVCHRRVGDYSGLGWPVVSKKSYFDAIKKFRLVGDVCFCTEENPTSINGIPKEIAFAPDFIRMMRAAYLLRGNSTFSWWAAALSDGQVFSPVVLDQQQDSNGEVEAEFIKGNSAKTTNFDFIDNLTLKPE